MRYTRDVVFAVALFGLFSIFHASPRVVAGEEDGLVSTMSMMPGEPELDGVAIRQVPELSGVRYTEDYGPSQVLEIIRPGDAPLELGRLYSSCGCLRASTEKKRYEQGERALLEVRNVKPTLPDGATYMLFIQINAPAQGILQYDIFAKSERR